MTMFFEKLFLMRLLWKRSFSYKTYIEIPVVGNPHCPHRKTSIVYGRRQVARWPLTDNWQALSSVPETMQIGSGIVKMWNQIHWPRFMAYPV